MQMPHLPHMSIWLIFLNSEDFYGLGFTCCGVNLLILAVNAQHLGEKNWLLAIVCGLGMWVSIFETHFFPPKKRYLRK